MSLNAQPAYVFAITPSDTLNLPFVTKWISFANTGTQTLAIDSAGGQINVSIILPAGQWRIAAKKVYSTGTTVTSIVGYAEGNPAS